MNVCISIIPSIYQNLEKSKHIDMRPVNNCECFSECLDKRIDLFSITWWHFYFGILGHNITPKSIDTNQVNVFDLCRIFFLAFLSSRSRPINNKEQMYPESYNLYLLTIWIQAISLNIVLNRCLELFCIVISSRTGKSNPLTVISIYTNFW